MNDKNIEVLKEMIIDFNEYSTDYTKTRCREIEQVLIDTLDYINQLQSNWNSLKEWLKENEDKISYMEDVIDKMNELEGVDNESNSTFK